MVCVCVCVGEYTRLDGLSCGRDVVTGAHYRSRRRRRSAPNSRAKRIDRCTAVNYYIILLLYTILYTYTTTYATVYI